MRDVLHSLMSQLGISAEAPPTAGQWADLLLALEAQMSERQIAHLTAELSHFRTAVRSLGEGLCLLDEAGQLQYINPEGERLLGYGQIELFGRPILPLIDHQFEHADSRALLHQLVGLGLEYRNEYGRFRRANGATFPVSFVVTPMLKQGALAGAVLIFRDMTAQREMEAELERQVRDTVLLNRVIAAVTSTSDTNTILTILCTQLAYALNLPQAACALLNEAKASLVVVAEYLEQGRLSALGAVIPVQNNPATEYVLAHKRPLVVADAQHDERLATRELSRQRGTVSMLLMPLMIGDDVIGTMGLNATERRDFTEDEIYLALNVAAAASQALQKAALDQKLQQELAERRRTEQMVRRQNAYLETLHETALGLINRLDTTSLLESIVGRAGALVGTPHGYLYVAENDRADIRMRAGTGIFQPFLGSHLQAGEGLSGEVWRTGEMMCVADYGAWYGKPSKFGRVWGAVSMPLRSGPVVTGVIGLVFTEEGRAFAPEELETLQRFAQLAAVALDNSLLYSALQQELVEREWTQRELLLAKEAAEAANQTKTNFLASMSHELRTPLNAILGYSELLYEDLEALGEGHLAADVHRIRSAGQLLLQIINDILDIARIEAGDTHLQRDLFALGDVLETLQAIVEPMCEAGGNVFVVEMPAELGLMRADASKVRQALFNLLHNANKFTTHGRVTLRVVREEQNGQGWVRFEVADTGIGIAEGDLERIFEPFMQVDNTHSRRYGGTGLGLAICRRFCQLMGGSVTAESVVGEGSVFTVRLPVEV